MTTDADVIVIGAGVGGLAAAWALGREGARVVVFERSSRIGGLVETEHAPSGVLLEHGADGILPGKRGGMATLEALGLAEGLVRGGRAAKQAFVWDERGLLPMPGGLFSFERRALWSLLLSPLLSPRAKLRLAAEPLVPRASAPDEAVASFFARRLGEEIEARLCAPMVRGIYGAESTEIGVRSVFPTLAGFEDRFGSVGLALAIAPRTPSGGLVTPRLGMESIATRLAAASRARLVLGRAAKAIALRPRGVEVRLDDGSALSARGVVVATEVGAAAELLAPLSAPLGALLGEVRATSVEVVSLVFRRAALGRPLRGTGFVVSRPGTSTLACTFASEKWHGRAPDDLVVLRSVLRSTPDATSEELVARAREELTEALGELGEPTLTRVRRRPHALPVYGVGHCERVKRALEHTRELGPVALAGNHLFGVGVPDSIASGLDAAAALSHATA